MAKKMVESHAMSDANPSPQLPRTLGPVGLTIGLVLLTAIPFLFVVLLYVTLPTSKDPELVVQASIGPGTWISNDGTQSRLLPSLFLKNPTQDLWRNLNISINGQYYYFHPEPVQAGGELSIPLKFFHTKGNQFFSLESQSLNELTVYAQIPSGARAIKKLSGESLRESKSANSPKEQEENIVN